MSMFLAITGLLLALTTLSVVHADSQSFQASPSISADIPFLLSHANTIIQKNSSTDASATFLIGIGATTYSTIYTNWPVLLLYIVTLRFRIAFSSGQA